MQRRVIFQFSLPLLVIAYERASVRKHDYTTQRGYTSINPVAEVIFLHSLQTGLRSSGNSTLIRMAKVGVTAASRLHQFPRHLPTISALLPITPVSRSYTPGSIS
jgi:hypothetical protein